MEVQPLSFRLFVQFNLSFHQWVICSNYLRLVALRSGFC